MKAMLSRQASDAFLVFKTKIELQTKTDRELKLIIKTIQDILVQRKKTIE